MVEAQQMQDRSMRQEVASGLNSRRRRAARYSVEEGLASGAVGFAAGSVGRTGTRKT